MRKRKHKKLKVTRYLGDDSWGNEPASTRDIGSITTNAYHMLLELDEQLTGTEDYMGMAYFWGHEYKHYLRDCSYAQRRKIHKRLMAENIELTGKSDRYLEIIKDVTGLV